MSELIRISNLTSGYNGEPIIRNISLGLFEKECFTIFGPNGSGKTTLVRSLVGILDEYNGKISHGKVEYQGEDITGLKPFELIKKRIAFLPDGGKIFPSMTVIDNLYLGGFLIQRKEMLVARIHEIMALFPILKPLLRRRAFTLSGGERQILALARSLIIDPKVLILDEPSMGLSISNQEHLFSKLNEVKQNKLVIIVEQNIQLALRIADRGCVINDGCIDIIAPVDELKANPVITALIEKSVSHI